MTRAGARPPAPPAARGVSPTARPPDGACRLSSAGPWRIAIPPLALAIAVVAAGCAPAAPVLAGGRGTPSGRTALAAGGATRVALGQLRAQDGPAAEAARQAAWAGGTVPVAAVRHGIDGWDVGLVVAGPVGRLEVRREVVLQEGLVRVAAILGGGVVAGLATDGDDLDGETGARWGLEIPAILGVDVTGLGELWIGTRARFERVAIDLDPPPDPPGPTPAPAAPFALDATGIQIDGVLGYAWGFRNLHVLLELAVGHAWWTSAREDARGVVLTPAFVVRWRI